MWICNKYRAMSKKLRLSVIRVTSSFGTNFSPIFLFFHLLISFLSDAVSFELLVLPYFFNKNRLFNKTQNGFQTFLSKEHPKMCARRLHFQENPQNLQVNCVKSDRIRSFSSSFSVRMQENTDKNIPNTDTFHVVIRTSSSLSYLPAKILNHFSSVVAINTKINLFIK